jgi:hypothetical protein
MAGAINMAKATIFRPILFTSNPISIAVQMPAVSWISRPHGRRTSRSGRAAISERQPTFIGRLNGRAGLRGLRPSMAVVIAGLSVVVTTLGVKAAGMREGNWDIGK